MLLSWEHWSLFFLLSVSRDASDADIRKAYKKLSKKYHPDKNSEEGAKEKFVEIAHGAFVTTWWLWPVILTFVVLYSL